MPPVDVIPPPKGNRLLSLVAGDLSASARVLKSSDIAALVSRRRRGEPSIPASAESIGKATVARIGDALADTGALRRVRRGLYVNRSCVPPAADWEAAPLIRGGAFASLLTVLGDYGILNNRPRDIWCVMPRSVDAPTGGPSEVRSKDDDAPVFRFLAIDGKALHAPDAVDLFDGSASARATPEAALAHWLYLSMATSRPGRRPLAPPPVHDIDFSMLDLDRLARVCAAMGGSQALETWMATRDLDDEEKVADWLGF